MLTAGVPGVSAAVDNSDETDEGRLKLNSDVLVNESVDTGTVGDFMIRGRLFSTEIAARVQAQQEAAASRLDVVDHLTFVDSRVGGDEYQDVRASLFDGYAPEVRSGTYDVQAGTPLAAVLAVALGVPLVLCVGVMFGRVWARRKRVKT